MFFYFFAFLSHKKKESNSFSIKKRIRFHKHIYQIYYIYFKYYIKIYLLLLLNSYFFLQFPNISFFYPFSYKNKRISNSYSLPFCNKSMQSSKYTICSFQWSKSIPSTCFWTDVLHKPP